MVQMALLSSKIHLQLFGLTSHSFRVSTASSTQVCHACLCTNVPAHQLRSSANGKVITSVSEATYEDVDAAVNAAQKAFDTTWGLNASGTERSILLYRFARLMEENADELAALETLNNGAVAAYIPAVFH